MKPKIGIVDVGGGYRGVYAAGVMDYCMHKGIRFDLGIGVSAGSANLASYCARQPQRNHKFYIEYGLRKEYASFRNYRRDRSYINLPYIYGTLTNSDGEYPLDYDAMMENPMEFLTVVTDATTGQPGTFRSPILSKMRTPLSWHPLPFPVSAVLWSWMGFHAMTVRWAIPSRFRKLLT